MIALDLNPDDKKLKQFGIFSLFGFGLIGAVVARHLGCFDGGGNWLPSQILWGIGVISFILAFVKAPLLKPLFVLLTVVTFPIGFVVSNVILFLIYAVLFVPIALFFKLTGRDPLLKKFEPNATSYWIDRNTDVELKRYYHQY